MKIEELYRSNDFSTNDVFFQFVESNRIDVDEIRRINSSKQKEIRFESHFMFKFLGKPEEKMISMKYLHAVKFWTSK